MALLFLFFFQSGGEIMAKCLQAKIHHKSSSSPQIFIPAEPRFDSTLFSTVPIKDFWQTGAEILLAHGQTLADRDLFMYQEAPEGFHILPVVNSWRPHANGHMIKHVPIILYSNNTSGNVSKKWNKHMSVFFTLAGLPPKMTNEEFNIHFLATSNCASALELLDEVVDDLNTHSSEGFMSYDHTTGTDVLVMVTVLCHLGDGPMHAEISNTTNPANTLTPCRIYDLHVTGMADKKKETYVSDFIGMNQAGEEVSLPKRQWDLTCQWTMDLWTVAQNPRTKSIVESKARKDGLRDSTLDFFIKKVQYLYEKKDPNDV
ncbi:hypothetical protein DFH28DRAFT_924348 [Melampsora americana]|nr:hypothetical protein DFH28DRAFT_924348 [Melampsora americana]